MSVFSRFIHPIPSTRRAYSFFSSKSGGRYFNSSRPPKVVSGAVSATSSVDAAGPSVKANNGVSEPHTNPKDELAPLQAEPAQVDALHATPIAHPFAPIHPLPSAQDCRLNQFFSLHRPLLLLPQAPGAVFDSVSTDAVSQLGSNAPATAAPAFEEPPEASPEADADAARQLARAIVVNRLAANASFEAALRRLGLRETDGATRVEDIDLSALEVHLESTKRKRRSKMKKHKCVLHFSSTTSRPTH